MSVNSLSILDITIGLLLIFSSSVLIKSCGWRVGTLYLGALLLIGLLMALVSKHFDEGVGKMFSFPIVFAAIFSGAIIGFTQITETERNIRGTSKLDTVSSVVIRLLIISVIMLIVPIAILELFGAYPLSQFDRYTFVVVWFLAIAITKFIRYFYWKNLVKTNL